MLLSERSRGIAAVDTGSYGRICFRWASDLHSGAMTGKERDNELSPEETAERLDRALRRSFNMPHKPHKPVAPKPKERAASKGRVRKGKSRS